MEEDVSGESSFSDINLDAPRSEFGKYLDQICPYYMLYGMSWDEFWHSSLDRLGFYWQKHQFDIEKRNQELWMQGLYIRMAVASCLDGKRAKYPDKPQRITELTEMEKELENQRKVNELRNALMEHKRRWDAKHKGVEAGDR